MKNKFGKNIAQLRKKNGWSQKETAVRLGISQALLSHYEKGIRECGLDFLCKAATVFKCSTDYLLGLKEENPTNKSDADNVSADLKEFPKLEKSRTDVLNTLNLLYSITARIGNPEIAKDFRKMITSRIYMLIRSFGKSYFADENFNKSGMLAISYANQREASSYASIVNKCENEHIMVNLSKQRISEEYPVCSKSFYNIINIIEK